MLIAKNDQGLYVNALIDGINKQNAYFCPACLDRVIAKNGKVIRPHFAHRKVAICHAASEGETQAHIMGKQFLYQAAINHPKLNKVQLERYFQQIKQRTDIYIDTILPFAIEYQCSPLAFERFYERRMGYASLNIKDIWILGKAYELFPSKRIREDLYQYFFYTEGLGYALLYLIEDQLTCLHHIKFSQATNLLLFQTLGITIVDLLQLDCLAPFEKKEMICSNVDQRTRERWRYSKPKWYVALNHYLYRIGVSFHQIPEVFFSYPQQNLLMDEPNLLWKSLFYFYAKEDNWTFASFDHFLSSFSQQGILHLHPLWPETKDILVKDLYDSFKSDLIRDI